jgi:RNA polymerase sigma-70 factor (ECF subfamily)
MATTSTAIQFEDDTLIKRVLAGDEESFAVLVERHIGSIRKCIACIVRNDSDTEDVVQDVLLKLWSRLSTFRSESTFRSWATRVAVNETLMLYRRERNWRTPTLIEDLDRLEDPREMTDQTLIRAEVVREVRRALERLPRLYSTVLILRDLEQLSLKETAQRVNATVPAVKTRLFRGRLLLSAAIRMSASQPLVNAA